MTLPRLAEIRARLEAATPGPWGLDGLDIFDSEGRQIATVFSSAGVGAGINSGTDAQLIANAPEDIRRLIAVVEVWGAALEKLSDRGVIRARTALSDARKIIGSEQEGGAGE